MQKDWIKIELKVGLFKQCYIIKMKKALRDANIARWAVVGGAKNFRPAARPQTPFPGRMTAKI